MKKIEFCLDRLIHIRRGSECYGLEEVSDEIENADWPYMPGWLQLDPVTGNRPVGKIVRPYSFAIGAGERR